MAKVVTSPSKFSGELAMIGQRIVWPAIVGLAFVAGTAWQVATGQGPNAKPVQKWEYKTVRATNEVEKLGDEGWELVAVAGTGDSFTKLYFKRAK